VAPATSPRAAELCDWLTATTLPDGGLPFGLPVADATATAPFWAEADPTASSLHMTAAVAAVAQRVARHDPAVAARRRRPGGQRVVASPDRPAQGSP
jgi:hypothetical protein